MTSTVPPRTDDDGIDRQPTMNLRDPKTSRVSLAEDEVHLWWGGPEDAIRLHEVRASLSDEELGRCERFRRERDARAFLFRRAFLRRVLARYASCEARELVFGQGEFGKPFLVGHAANLAFNASSSQSVLLVAVTREREIGVDVERIDETLRGEELSRLARRVLTARERGDLESLPEEQSLGAFLRAWTRKEALLKALGTGFSREPGTVEVGLEAHLGERALSDSFFPGRCARSLDLDAPEGFAACVVAADRRGGALRYGFPLDDGS